MLNGRALKFGVPYELRSANSMMEEYQMKHSPTPLCFIVNCDYNAIGGAMTRFRTEVEYFSSKGHYVAVIYSSYGRERFFRKGKADFYNIRHIRRLPILYQARLLFKCLKLRLFKKQLIFIVHEPISLIPPALLRFIGLRPKTVLIMHGPMAIETFLRGNKTIAAFLSIIDRVAFRLAGKIVAVSEYERNYAIRLKTDPRKIAIIRNGIEFSTLTDRNSFRKEMRISPDKLTVGYIGSIAAYRGVDYLVEGFSIAKAETGLPLALVLVFREEPTEEQKEKIKDMTGSNYDDIYISKPMKNVSPVLSALDIYASHFSRKVDGIGFSIMEAMGSALPVITGKDEITDALLKDGSDAILVDKENPRQIAEAIRKLASDAPLRAKIGKRARETAMNEFSRSRMLALCEQEYLDGPSN